MEDRLLVEALRSRDPGALAAVYDAYATRLYAYCWSHLLNRDAAQVALRDTFIVAEAHIDRLRDNDRFAPWIYAIARIECARRMPLPGQQPDIPIASHDQDDVDQRLLAWRAVRTLSPREREALELRVLHQLAVPDFAFVLDRPAREVQELLDEARAGLRAALTAEILAHLGPYGCDGRAEILGDRDGGELDPVLRARLLAHAEACSVCGAHRPSEGLSPAKVFGLLPYADAPASLRVRVISCFTDPELVSYRLFVATRVTEFTSAGFPRQAPRAIAPTRGKGRRLARLGLVSALVVAGAITVASFVGWLASDQTRTADTTGSHSTPGEQRTLAPSSPTPPTSESGPLSATFPLGVLESAVPEVVAVPAPPPAPPSHIPQTDSEGHGTTDPPGGPGTLEVSPRYLDVGTGSDGTVILQARGGDLVWRAKVDGPIRLSIPSGKLKKGETATVRVHVFRTPRSRGEGTLTFGSTAVTVTWRPVPPPTTTPPTDHPTTPPDPTPTQPSHTPPPHTDPPHTDPPTSPPPHTDPPHTDPPHTDPPHTDPPHTDPPVSDPPATTPPADPPTSAAASEAPPANDTDPVPGTNSAAPDA